MSLFDLPDDQPGDQDGTGMLFNSNKDELLRHGGRSLYDNFL